MFLIKCYWVLKNTRATAITLSELLRENQQGEGGRITPHLPLPPRLGLNEKHIEQGLYHKNLQEITIKYHSDQRKQRYKLVDKVKKQPNRIVIDKKLWIKVTMDNRTTSEHICETRLIFKQYDVLLTKKQLLLTKIMSIFEGENMQTQYKVIRLIHIFMTISWQ